MRKELYKQILEISIKQSMALKENDVEMLQQLLNEKQIIIDKINDINSKNYIELDEEEKDILNKTKEVADQNDIEFMKQYEEAKEKVRDIRSNKKREQAYSNPYSLSSEEGVFFDKRYGGKSDG